MLRPLVAFALLVTLCTGATVRSREEPEAVGLDEATVEKIAPNLAQMAHDMFSGKKPGESLVKAAAVDLMRGGPQPSWTKNLGGPYWKYGMCSSSSFWKTAGFGAPWFVHAGGVSRVKKLKNLNEAKQCSKPLVHYAVKDITEVRTASEYYMTSQRMGVLGSGGGDVPAKGMEYCFRMIVKNSPASPHVFCCDLHAERSQWVSSIKKQMELNQLSNGLQETPRLRGPSHMHFPPAPNTICGVADGSPCLAALPPPSPKEANASEAEDVKRPTLAVMKPIRWARSAPIKASKDQTWEVIPVAKPEMDDASKKKQENQDISGNEGTSAVRICQTGENLCLTLDPKVKVLGQVPLPPKRFFKCDGGDYKCFDITSQKVGMHPTKTDTASCQQACHTMNVAAKSISEQGVRSSSPKCEGWTYIRPESVLAEFGTPYARCCLKNVTVAPSQCKSNRCCDSHMAGDTKPGMVEENAGHMPGIPDRVIMREAHEAGADWRTQQHWEINPVGKGEYANTHCQLKLVYGGLCLSRNERPTPGGRDGLVMTKCVDGNEATIPPAQIFKFNGFGTLD